MTVLPAPTSPPVISPQPVITPTPATLITPTHPQSDTGVFFISHYYSIVFVLDMTSTMLQVVSISNVVTIGALYRIIAF